MNIKDEVKRDVPSRPHVARSQADIQRLKLEKLMKNPDKPVVIPDKPKTRGPPVVPDFVRNVMGSSAGAGSGEFHVYRHLRRKEYARQHYMHARAAWEKLEGDYHEKIEENKRKAEDETARRRAKRLKKKRNQKKGKNQVKKAKESSSESDSNEESEEDNTTVQDTHEHAEMRPLEEESKHSETTTQEDEGKEKCHTTEVKKTSQDVICTNIDDKRQ